MARPEIIARLHEAWYEMQFASDADKAAKERIYRRLLKEASRSFQVSEQQLQHALKEDFYIWRRQEGLPPLPPRHRS